MWQVELKLHIHINDIWVYQFKVFQLILPDAHLIKLHKAMFPKLDYHTNQIEAFLYDWLYNWWVIGFYF